MDRPLDLAPVEEVLLPHAPLITVLAQVRWPEVTHLKLNIDDVVTRVGERLADDYPLYLREKEFQLAITPRGPIQQESGTIYQFKSADQNWKVSLSQSFVTLDVKNYTSRKDFIGRFEQVLQAVDSAVKIPFVSRIGFRYVNRIEESDEYSQLTDHVQFAALGGGAVPLAKGVELNHSLSEAIYKKGDVQLLARSAHLPPGATTDPAISAASNRSWILDLDAFQEGEIEFNTADLATKMSDLASIAYSFFRWAIDDDFLRMYGGDV
ncbi:MULTISPECIES: TIGR04255 family protein [Amycolatopsis]|uniref:TIGR04255 family protein n=1 Tax=Amycolatopsis bullii TaxID=941987 RepID=A0ABQ3KFF5_9PSEU|nr:TIGR04255 family protein [Amycolatopsis bullii]GHG18769.1 hypothetical protein GCM10017567_41550 [Amycolatopsis bullii]